MFFQGLCFDVICFGCHASDETHKVETLRYVVHYFVLLFAGILHWLCCVSLCIKCWGFLHPRLGRVIRPPFG